jgi:hypothetical protein
MKLHDQEKQIRKLLKQGGCNEEEIAKVMRAISELRQNVPRLSDKDVDRLTSKAVQKIEEHFPQLKQPTAKEKVQKVAKDIALALAASGIWELLVYVSHHVQFSFASAGQDWKAADRGRAAAFEPTRRLSRESQENLSEYTLLLFAWKQGYLNEVAAALETDTELSSVAQASMNTFFYQDFLKFVSGTLMKEGERLTTDGPSQGTS